MKCSLPSAAIAAVLLSSGGATAFAPASGRAALVPHGYGTKPPRVHRDGSRRPAAPRLASEDDGADQGADGREVRPPRRGRRSRFLAAVRRRSQPAALALLTGAGLARLGGPLPSFLRPPPARASAPIVLRPAMEKQDAPMVKAMKEADELRKKKSMEEFDAFMAKCNDIEEAEGKAARAAFEKQYEIDKAEREAQKKRDVEKLKRHLLDKGQDPFTELDAHRQWFLLEHDVDLEKISGTPQNELMTKNFLKKRGKKAAGEDADHQKNQRYIVACQVADLKARGVDPMQHFGQPEVMEKTRALYKMDDNVAAKVAAQYRTLMEQHGGRLTPAKAGEVPFVWSEDAVDLAAAAGATAAGKSASAAKEAKAAAQAKLAAEKAAVREARLAEKARSKTEQAMAKEARMAEKAAAKEARMAEKAKAKEAKLTEKAAAAGASAAASAVASATLSLPDDDVAATANGEVAAAAGNDAAIESKAAVTQQPEAPSKGGDAVAKIKSQLTVRNAITVVVGAGALKYGVDYYKENNAAAQSERERQLKLILGGDEEEDEDEEDDEFDDDEDDDYAQFTKQKKPTPPTPKPKPDAPKTEAPVPAPAPKPAPKPRRLGIFAKRNADARETDLNALVKPNAQAPELAALLTQILTFGAPGRFPNVASWARPAPLEEFDLEAAKSLLVEARAEADLTDAQSAEIFASVVNCMIIDIVDLASSTLKGKSKDEKVTVEAINVVMDFMDHAASLFDAVAKDVTIKPVTYGGNLRKKDLEQMFSVYAGSSMMSLDGSGSTQDRVDTLQLVFAISDKKAEGLMQKHMMKMMMNLMKDGGEGLEGMPGMEGMEGMEEMMKAMGGMEGMGGLPGMDGEMSPEDLKQTLGMMKELMDSGQVSEEELVEVRKQFKEMYGSDISDLINKASEEGSEQGMTDDERELLDTFKMILGE